MTTGPHLIPDGRGGVLVVTDGTPQSHVHLGDPELLAFEYVQHMAIVVDAVHPRPGPVGVTHVGGAGLTLARWVEATRPGSPQIVLEPDAALTELVRAELPLPRRHRIRVRPVDGLTGIQALRDASADVLVTDAFAGGRVPASLAGPAYLREVLRVLRPDGLALFNLADAPGWAWVRQVLATLAAASRSEEGQHGSPEGTLQSSCLLALATSEVMKGRRFGNVVLAVAPGGLPEATIRRAAASCAFPTGLRSGAELVAMAARARPFTDADAVPSPDTPAGAFLR